MAGPYIIYSATNSAIKELVNQNVPGDFRKNTSCRLSQSKIIN
jgi:hypothetical protein